MHSDQVPSVALPPDSSAAPLVFITGFLGSGKTTLLNALLAARGPTRVGVIVNEWGAISVDGRLVDPGCRDGLVELPGGQIFCACISGSFIDAIARMSRNRPDLVLVETSGLARPAAMGDIVTGAVERSLGAVRYGATICVVDATRFDLLYDVAAAAREQAEAADLFVIAKTDMATPAGHGATLARLRAIRPDAPVFEIPSGRLPGGFMNAVLAAPATGMPREIPGATGGWGPGGRPMAVSFRPGETVALDRLERFLTLVSARVLRAKGILEVRFPDGSARPVLAEIAGLSIGVRAWTGDDRTPLVIVGERGSELSKDVMAAWRRSGKP